MHIENEFMVSLQIWMLPGKEGEAKQKLGKKIFVLYIYIHFPTVAQSEPFARMQFIFPLLPAKCTHSPQKNTHTERELLASSYLPTGTLALFIKYLQVAHWQDGKTSTIQSAIPQTHAAESLTSHNWLCYDKHCTIVHWFGAFNFVPICFFVEQVHNFIFYLCVCLFGHGRLQKIKKTISKHFLEPYRSKFVKLFQR